MRLLKRLLRFLVSRRLWTFVGVLVLCWLVWAFGPLVAVGEVEPLASEVARLIAIGAILFLWLLSVLLGQLRAARANRTFVAELAKAPPQAAHDPTGEVAAKFRTVLEDLRRGKGGSRRLLSEMPWYLLIGPPGTGKTTALRQSGLDFPMDLSDDLKGVGGTRNCDWFFTNDAVLLDTAGRYTEQASAPEADAAEWRGFLDLLKRHRGRRSLNGVVVAISLRELLGPTEALRLHARAVRRRLAELREGLAIHLPTYLLVTKLDLLPGFETFFADLSTSEREQVWGWTLRTDAPADGAGVERELRDLAGRAERRLDGRLAEDLSLRERAEAFRFPAQLLRLEAPLRSFVALEQVLRERAGDVLFAMNAGMFDDAGKPIGLAVSEGWEAKPINRRTDGGGNFHMQPNGVFLVRKDGRAEVVTTSAFKPADDIRLATQSGPMLVVDGRLNPRFDADGRSRYVRNGVGVDEAGEPVFAISDAPVSFGKFARLFRDELGCREALYLDGSVGSLWDPAANRMDSFAPIGPMLVAFKSQEQRP